MKAGHSAIGRLFVAAACGAWLAAAAPVTYAQEVDEIVDRQTATRNAYAEIARQMGLSEERLAAISSEVEALKKDERTLTAALIQAAKTERKLSEEAAEIEQRIVLLDGQELGLRQSLAERRGVLAEVLGALQRMGLNPPPAILVRPEDALSSVRSAILLGAVVPEMRAETEILIADLRELGRLSTTIAAERDRLLETVAEQAAEQERLGQLIAEKAKLRSETEDTLEAERQRAGELAAKASSLRELIATLEEEIEKARRAEAAASAPPDIPVPDENRLAAPVPFESLVGQVSLPVSGRIGLHFGEPDGAGGTMFGDIVTTQSGAIVTAPADGSVLYAGPFRSYGQLLILNAGDGYHIVLAGMGRISVALGQSVLAGEPVGTMGEARLASALALVDGNTEPELYVEFRKNGKPVDPTPWWAQTYSGRTANDS
ncbi:MAG: murein hydrolase activator EnvC [Rhizobiaceae bacterium]|nr:murein hydrolase activator EnvC [Rhizobiaceae bacterium]